MTKEQLMASVERMKDGDIINIPCGTLKAAGVDPDKLADIPDGRPVPVLVGDIRKLCGPKKRKKKTDAE